MKAKTAFAGSGIQHVESPGKGRDEDQARNENFLQRRRSNGKIIFHFLMWLHERRKKCLEILE